MLKFTNDKTQYGLLPLIKSSNPNISHIFINGFMSDEIEDYKAKDWQNGLKDILNKDEQKFIFKWESGLDYSKFKNHLPFQNGLEFELKRINHIAQTYNKVSDNSFLSNSANFLLSLPASFSSYMVEEWKNSNQNSLKYGKTLAKEIENLINEDKKIYLYAHSLGTNLVKNTLLELANKNITIEKVYLLGGATIHSDKHGWKSASETTKYGIHNFYSKNDSVLKYLYKTFELGNNPIGLNPILVNSKNIKNYDVSNLVNGHFEYKDKLQTIFKI
jgi:hypothetical protein